MPTITHAITVTINGTDRSSLVQKDSLYIRTSIANRGDVANFTIMNLAGSYIPVDWDAVTIAVNGTAVFGGYIVRRQARGVGDGANKIAFWSIECQDWSILLDQTIVNYGYTDTADTDIVIDLFDRYLLADGFDTFSELTTVDADVDAFFENIPLREALNQLAALAGANWHIAADKTVYWYAPASPAAAAFNIDTVFPNNSTTFDVLAGSLEHSIDASSIVNKVRVIGGEEPGALSSNLFDADGAQERFGPFTYKPGSVRLITYVIGGTTYYAYPSAVGYEPEDTLAFDGGNYDVIMNLDERYMIIKDSTGSVPDAATAVTLSYYALQQVDVTVEDTGSQAAYNRIFEKVLYDESLNTTSATGYANNVLGEYAYGRETISFDVTEHGLLPGRLITIHAPTVESSSTFTDALALETGVGYDAVLQEDDASLILLESYGESKTYIIQDVTLRAVATAADQFMVIASVSCGKYVPSLVDSLSTLQQFSAGTNRLPARRNVGTLDRVSNNMGEIVSGRAVFTDGGTAPFSWAAYNDHTGAVIGLEDSDNSGNAYGALYILNDGTVQAKLGFLDGLPVLQNGGTPTGWGLYTQNGYFEGVVSASQIIGGTVATTTPPINSGNPGVFIDSTGLWGYGTIGLTFKLPTDPADRPVFSSGTITETIYEVSTSSVLRTGTANPRVQIDNSGIFAYDSGGTARFTVDAATGFLTASKGTFSGTVSASVVTGGTVTGGTITGQYITGGSINAPQMTGGTITAGLMSGGTVSGAVVSGGTVTTVGGTVTLSDAKGLRIETDTSLSYNFEKALNFKNSGDTSVAAVYGFETSGTSGIVLQAGKFTSNDPGYIAIQAGGTHSNIYSYYNQGMGGTAHIFGLAGTTPITYTATFLQVSYNQIDFRGDFVPLEDDTFYVGNTTRQIKGIYLHDQSTGSTRLLTINNGTVLIS